MTTPTERSCQTNFMGFDVILLFCLSQSQHRAVVKLTVAKFCNWLSCLAGARAILPEETPLALFLFSWSVPGGKRQVVGAS